MAVKNVDARCINCYEEVRKDDENCRKCGDRVKPRKHVEIKFAEAVDVQAGQEYVATYSDPPKIIESSNPQEPHSHWLKEAEPSRLAIVGNTERMAEAAARYLEAKDRASRPHPLKAVGRFTGVEITTAKSSGATLTIEQDRAMEAIRGWYGACMTDLSRNTWPVFRLFGPAGTGKTTMAKHVAASLGLDRVVFGAFTGKAAKVLRSKGVDAHTIHSSIYELDFKPKARAELRQVQDDLSMANLPYGPDVEALIERERELLDAIRKPAFTLNPFSEWSRADLIVLDEVSMVNEAMARDIESYGVPVLVLGDPCQLPPIDGAGYYTAREPDVLLDEVHRQALESPVLALATHVRQGGSWAGRRVKVNLDEAMAADQILVWKNSTRWALTKKIREKRKLPAAQPVAGDRIMALVNNKDMGIFNGEQFTVKDVKGGQQGSGEWLVELIDDDGRDRGWMGARGGGFRDLEGEQAERRAGGWRGDTGVFAFADVITTHKAQGSEWDHVYVVDQTHLMTRATGAERRAWIYTAVSRASQRVTIASTDL